MSIMAGPDDNSTRAREERFLASLGMTGRACSSASTKECMIIGMGIDVEEVERVKGAIERQGERFLKRIFTEKERAYCEQFKDKYERYAGRFAVKEAAIKALGAC